MWGRTQTLVMTDTRDEKGSMWRAVELSSRGLTIVGQDVGPGVREVFGFDEYEFTRTLDSSETAVLQRLLGVRRRKQLLDAIRDRFRGTHDLEQFLADHGLSGTYWNRIGD